MLETGDFVVIRYHDDLRNKKPVAIHWLQSVAVAAISGPTRATSRTTACHPCWARCWPRLARCGRAPRCSTGAPHSSAPLLLGTTLLLTTEANIAKTDAAQCGDSDHGHGGACPHAPERRREQWHGRPVLGAPLHRRAAQRARSRRWSGFSTIAGLFIWERRDGKWNADWARPLLYWVGLSLF